MRNSWLRLANSRLFARSAFQHLIGERGGGGAAVGAERHERQNGENERHRQNDAGDPWPQCLQHALRRGGRMPGQIAGHAAFSVGQWHGGKVSFRRALNEVEVGQAVVLGQPLEDSLLDSGEHDDRCGRSIAIRCAQRHCGRDVGLAICQQEAARNVGGRRGSRPAGHGLDGRRPADARGRVDRRIGLQRRADSVGDQHGVDTQGVAHGFAQLLQTVQAVGLGHDRQSAHVFFGIGQKPLFQCVGQRVVGLTQNTVDVCGQARGRHIDRRKPAQQGERGET